MAPTMSVILAGLTGAGKSTVCNSFTGASAAVGDGAKAVTQDMRTYSGNGFSVTDVPGLGDPELSTRKWLELARAISEKSFDHMIFVVNASTHRVGNDTMLLALAIKHLGTMPSSNVSVVFTHCDAVRTCTPQWAGDFLEQLGKTSGNAVFNSRAKYFFFGLSLPNNQSQAITWLKARQGMHPPAVKIHNLVDDALKIRKNIITDAAKVSDEVKEMAEIMTENACFNRNARVLLRGPDGELVSTIVGALRVGDIVASYDENTRALIDDTVVYVHDHADDFGAKVTFSEVVDVTFANDTSVHGTIQLSFDHYMLRHTRDGSRLLGPAQEVCVGERLTVIHHGQAVECDVVKVSQSVEPVSQMVHFMTAGKLAIVDDVVSSGLTVGWDSVIGRAVAPLFARFAALGKLKQSPLAVWAVSLFLASKHLAIYF